jgi:hypothetical protein
LDALITPEQLQKLQECQKARGGQHPAAHPRAPHPGGPCAQSPQQPQQPEQPQQPQ